MPCANQTLRPETPLEKDESERKSSSKRYRREIKPRITRDHTHIDPECVWGDEGPIND